MSSSANAEPAMFNITANVITIARFITLTLLLIAKVDVLARRGLLLNRSMRPGSPGQPRDRRQNNAGKSFQLCAWPVPASSTLDWGRRSRSQVLNCQQ